MRHIFWLLITMFVIGVAGVEAQDNGLISDDPPYPCPNSDGAYYQGAVYPRYDINTQSLLLINAETSESVRVLDTFVEDEIVRIINWSPDCRYLTGAVGITRYAYEGVYEGREYRSIAWEWNGRDIVFWDTVNGGRTYTFEKNPGDFLTPYTEPVSWSPDAQYALVLGGCTGVSVNSDCTNYNRVRYDILWQRNNNTSIRVGQLPFQEGSWQGEYDQSRSLFNQHYWDMTRSWLWGSDLGGVSAYDVNTGAEVMFFENFNSWPESRFVFSPDGTKVIVYSIAYYSSSNGGAGITVYDIDSRVGVSVNVEGLAAPHIPFADYHPVTLSSDNRYLVVGYDALRVWDLQNLPENVEERLPIYRHGGPEAHIWSVRFADWGVIETTSEEGTQRWDLHTGVYIP